MRIAYITQPYPPMVSGASFVVQRLAESMAARGHQVLVVAASDTGESYTVKRVNLTIKRLRSSNNPLRVSQRVMVFPGREILQALEEFQPDLIHSHELLQINLLGLHYARRAKIPTVMTVHQVPWFVTQCLPQLGNLGMYVEPVLWAYAYWLLRQFTSLVTPTQTISTLIHHMTKIQPQTISNGVDLNVFRPSRLASRKDAALRAKLGIPAGVPVILHVGQLHSGKRVDRVVQAVAGLIRETDAHLLVIGDGPDRLPLQRLCEKLGFTGRAHFPGYIMVEQGLADAYRLASVFVTASEIETQGIVLLEAAASGLPIVAVRATCIPEIVSDGENGYLSKSGDVNGLTDSLMALLQDPKKARAMGNAGRTLVESHASEHTCDLHEQIYRARIAEKYARPVKRNRHHQWALLRP